ncbi:hypothetical protein SNEBB_009949 [Seison nebaliae]|nr:hypothetical protein SNEBB_009949 [Seison nebaliae]
MYADAMNNDLVEGKQSKERILEATDDQLANLAALNSQSEEDTDEERTNLIVNYLPPSLCQDELYSLFFTIGKVESCRLIRDKLTGQSLGYGFVNYYKHSDAEMAIQTLNGLQLQNKSIKVSYARPSRENIKGANLYICGIPKEWTADDLSKLFAAYGKIITSRILYDKVTTSSRGVGFIRYDQKNEAELAIEKLNGSAPPNGTDTLVVKFANTPTRLTAASQLTLSQTQLAASSVLAPLLAPLLAANLTAPTMAQNISQPDWNQMHCNVPNTSSSMGTGCGDVATNMVPDGSPSNGYSIFVYNLAAETDENSLWQLFGPFGAVQNVNVVRDPETNKCKGFAFITMSNYDEAMMSISTLHGFTLNGRIIQVSFKKGPR